MQQRNSGGCLTAAMVAFSRFFLLFAWIARPIAFERVFGGSWIIPCLGIMILPFTTLMYVILATNGPGNLSGIDWLWMFLALLVDVANIGAAGAANRDRIPQGVPGAVAPPPPPPAAQ
jgi:hypothetical protein